MTPPLDAVVLIEQGVTACAGTIIDEHGTVATAYHCVASGGRPAITTHRGTRVTGRVVALDRKNDLAVIEVPDLAGEPWLVLRTAPAVLGEEVWALGHPMGAQIPVGFLAGTLRWSASVGVVSAVGDRAVQVSAPVNPGNSGGPIVDHDGLMMGVVSRRIPGDGLGFAARADRLEALLAEDRHPMSPLGGTIGAEVLCQLQSGAAGTISAGGRVEASFRDHLVLSGAFAVPFQAKWEAVQRGTVSWTSGEVQVGLRQRLFRGQGTMRFDAYGGETWRLSNTLQDDGRVTPDSAKGLLVGGRLALPGMGIGFDVGHAWYDDDTEGWRTGLVFTWPGTRWMF